MSPIRNSSHRLGPVGRALCLGALAAFACAALILPASRAEAQATGFYRASIDPDKLKWNRTKEQWAAEFTAGYYNPLGHRIVAWSTASGQWEYTDGANPAVWAAMVAAAGVTLDSAHATGSTITVTGAESGITINDSTTGITQMLDINSSGVVPGALSKTLADIATTAVHTTSGVVTLLNLNFAGTVAGGTPRGAVVTMPAAANNALLVPVGSVTLTNGNFGITAGNATLLAGNLTLTNGNVVHPAGNYTAADGAFSWTDTADEDVAVVVGNAVTTNQVLTLTGNAITTGDLILGNYDASDLAGGGGFALRLHDTDGGGADTFTVDSDGATVIAGTAGGIAALTLTAGDFAMTTGNVVHTAGNHTILAGVLDITPAATNSSALTMTGAGVRTANLITITTANAWTANQFQWTSAGAWTGNLLDVDAAGAWTGNALDITSGAGAATGNMVDLNVGAGAYAGDAINVNVGATSTTGQAVVVTAGAAARTSDLISITDIGTSTGDALHISMATTNAGAAGLAIEDSGAGAFAGPAIWLILDTAATGARGIIANRGGVAYTEDIITITADGGATAPTADAIGVTIGGAGAGTASNTAFRAAVSATLWQGDLVNLATNATCTACQAVVAAGGVAARTADLVTLTDAGTSTANTLSIAASGTQSGDLANLSFGVGVATGDGLDIAMGAANVAGRAVTIASAATATNTPGLGINVAHTGALASAGGTSSVVRFTSTGAWDADATNPTFLLDVDQNTAAGAAGDYAVRVNASGANVEALHVDAGTSLFDEAVTIGVAGAPVAGTQLNMEAAPATTAIYIDATTAGQQPTHTTGVININATSATADVRAESNTIMMAADVTGNVVQYSSIANGVGIGPGGARTQYNNYANFLGNAADTAADLLVSYYAYANKNGGAAITGAFVASGAAVASYDVILGAQDVALNIADARTAAAVGLVANWNAGNSLGAGNAAADLEIRGGENDQALGATSGGDGGGLHLRAGDATGDSTVARTGAELIVRAGDGLASAAVGGTGGLLDIRAGDGPGASPLAPVAGNLNARAGDNAGDAVGGTVDLRAGDSAGAIAGNGGPFGIRAGNSVAGVGGPLALASGEGGGANPDGTIVIQSGSAAGDRLTINDAAAPTGIGGINTIAAIGTVRPTKTKWIGVGEMTPVALAVEAVANDYPMRPFTEAAVGTSIVAFSWIPDSCVDDGSDVVVWLVWTDDAPAGGAGIAWSYTYKAVADLGATNGPLPGWTDVADALTGADQEERTLLMTILAAAWVPGDHIVVHVSRNGASGNDTLTSTVELLGAYVVYRSLCP